MKIILTERQYKTIIEQWWNDPKHPEWKKYAPTDYEKREVKKAETVLNNLDPHTIATIFSIGTAFIPVIGPFISAGIGLADAALYYKKGDTKAAGLTAAFSMIPFIGKIPGVKELGSKGMAALASKISKGVKSFSPAEIKVLTAVEQNQSVIKQGLEKASEALKPVVKSVESIKPKFISKFGQQKYDELLSEYIQGKITKEAFLKNLNSATGDTYKMAKMVVQSGLKFSKAELNGISELAPLIKKGEESVLKLELTVNGVNREIDVIVSSFPKQTFKGKAVGRNKIYMNLDKLVGKSVEEIRQVLSHEAAHIKDPSLVSPKLNKSYDKIMNAKATELSNYETAYAKASETGKGAEDAIKAGKKYQDLYQRYRYHPQEIVANNQMILNNMTSEMESLISKVGPNGAKKELDNLIGYASGKNSLSKESLGLLGDKGSNHLTGLYKYNKKSYNDFLKKIAKQSEYLKSQLDLMK